MYIMFIWFMFGIVVGFALCIICNRLDKWYEKNTDPLTYGELINLSVHTPVKVKEFNSNWIQHGNICIENGTKKVNVGDGVFELTEVDVWLDLD